MLITLLFVQYCQSFLVALEWPFVFALAVISVVLLVSIVRTVHLMMAGCDVKNLIKSVVDDECFLGFKGGGGAPFGVWFALLQF